MSARLTAMTATTGTRRRPHSLTLGSNAGLGAGDKRAGWGW